KTGLATIMAAVIAAVRAELGVTLSEVVLIKRGTLPKTSSGKVRRREAKRRLETNELELSVEGQGEDRDGSLPAPPSAEMPSLPTFPRSVPLQGVSDGIQ